MFAFTKINMGHVTMTKPILVVTCHVYMTEPICNQNLTTLPSAIPEVSLGAPRILDWSCDPDHAAFRGSLSSLG